MRRWPFSVASLKYKEDRAPWNAAIIPYLELKQIFDIMPEIPFRKAKYDDPPETSFLTQFVRLKLYLDAKLLNENSRVWKDLQEADPGFKKIRHIYYFAVYDSDVKPDGFPEEWRDEKYFGNWLYVNVMTQLRILDEGTLRRGTNIILYTNYVDKWRAEKQNYEENLEKQKRDLEKLEQKEKDQLEKGKIALEKKQKKWEEKLAKDLKKLILDTQRKLRENSDKMKESMRREEYADKEKRDWGMVWGQEIKGLDLENSTGPKETFKRAKHAFDQSHKWQVKSKEEREKQDKLHRERDKLNRELEHYESFVVDP